MQYLEFGNFIKQKRKALVSRTSLNEFAFNIGMDSATLSRIENCLQSIKLQDIGKVAKGFNMLASELIAEYESVIPTR